MNSIVFVLLLSVMQIGDESLITSKLKQYDSFVVQKNAQAVANCYTENGSYGYNVKGRPAIKEYLESFKNTNVVSFKSTINSLKISGNSAIMYGSFKQIVKSKKLTEHSGTFEMVWNKVNGEWLINSMLLTSKKSR